MTEINAKKVPAGLESTTKHTQLMAELSAKPGKVVRKDGNPEQAFQKGCEKLSSEHILLLPCSQHHGGHELFRKCYR